MKLGVALRLARVSNLPTVWSNVLVGVALVGGSVSPVSIGLLMLALSASYCGGMVLNDACDHRFDAAHRRERPIPQGDASVAGAWGLGLGLLAAGFGLCVVVAARHGVGAPVWWAASALAGTILLYDLVHRATSYAAWIMGACRGLTYVVVAVGLGGDIDREVVRAAAIITLYVTGLTFVARFEVGGGRPSLAAKLAVWSPWLVFAPGLLGSFAITFAAFGAVMLIDTFRGMESGERSVGATVARLVAAISLVDALILAALGCYGLAGLAVLAVPVCRRWQRRVPGS